ncbi:hypothetical protein MD588_25285 [Photobacterium sp. SDRW27]|uniref:hypothetical protein n=1 Tax=Photobacterium obscurum TaxID=2829490 RepID=UPI00224326DF|nr:hypothetical protein [Photobacterium obscurum]MCW8332110.1 hypothetical protein [Photobacterium obscurum]
MSIRQIVKAVVVATTLSLLFPISASAQKGIGETTGVAQQADKPPVTHLSGKLLEIRTGPCENTAGKSPVGTHLIVQDKDGIKLNIHLGPENAVDHIVDQLVIGQPLAAEVFRTERLPPDAYIAKSLLPDSKVIHLRDDNLRPSWAYGKGQGQAKGQGRGRWGACW